MSRQQMRVLMYLKDHRGITQFEATEAIGCLRLSERIRELAKMGYKIEKVWEDGVNRYGDKTRVIRYFVKEKTA